MKKGNVAQVAFITEGKLFTNRQCLASYLGVKVGTVYNKTYKAGGIHKAKVLSFRNGDVTVVKQSFGMLKREKGFNLRLLRALKVAA